MEELLALSSKGDVDIHPPRYRDVKLVGSSGVGKDRGRLTEIPNVESEFIRCILTQFDKVELVNSRGFAHASDECDHWRKLVAVH